MTSTPYPLPLSTRQTAWMAGTGVDTYGPFGDGWGLFDIADLLVETRPVGGGAAVPAVVTVTKVGPAAVYGTFTIKFDAVVTAATQYRVTGKRFHKRELAVTRGGPIDGMALELELSKQSVVLQEMRRDVDALPQVVEGTGAAIATAQAALAQNSATSAAAALAAMTNNLDVWCGDAAGTANALQVSHALLNGLGSGAPPDGLRITTRITAPSTGAMTLKAGPTTLKPLYDHNGENFANGQYQIGDIVEAVYSSTNNSYRANRGARVPRLRAAVSFTVTNITGTYVRSGNTITATVAGHGLTIGSTDCIVYFNASTGGATSGWYKPVVVNANTLTFQDAVSGATSGNCNLSCRMFNSFNVPTIVTLATGNYQLNFGVAMPNASYFASAIATFNRAVLLATTVMTTAVASRATGSCVVVTGDNNTDALNLPDLCDVLIYA